MRNLWQALALAWLGGIASPGLADDALLPDTLIIDEAPDPEPAGEDAAERDPALPGEQG